MYAVRISLEKAYVTLPYNLLELTDFYASDLDFAIFCLGRITYYRKKNYRVELCNKNLHINVDIKTYFYIIKIMLKKLAFYRFKVTYRK